jgi:lipocalin
MPDPNEPGKLKVSFFLWFYADYFVLELDEINYSYALIGSKSDKYLWILSRDKDLPKTTIDFLLGKAKERGYDTSKLIWVKHR